MDSPAVQPPLASASNSDCLSNPGPWQYGAL